MTKSAAEYILDPRHPERRILALTSLFLDRAGRVNEDSSSKDDGVEARAWLIFRAYMKQLQMPDACKTPYLPRS
jgi:hypothetical protein